MKVKVIKVTADAAGRPTHALVETFETLAATPAMRRAEARAKVERKGFTVRSGPSEGPEGLVVYVVNAPPAAAAAPVAPAVGKPVVRVGPHGGPVGAEAAAKARTVRERAVAGRAGKARAKR